MTAVLIVGVPFVVGVWLFAWALCRAAALADRRAEEEREHLTSQEAVARHDLYPHTDWSRR